MTATFGKLDHETLTLQPGLNILHAPNEWGKSTWCAFLMAMFYGMETRTHTTKTVLADKERYAPWSGSPMSGRIDLDWEGRKITIERRTKGRAVMGDFRAYETETGMAVPELTAANCGQMLLGVERSVFARAGFLRLSDLPVTQDESLRRRLNALVTTGDESGAGDILGQKLKELKNRCRFNRSGLLPQAEAQRDALQAKLRELEDLRLRSEQVKARQAELEGQLTQLENHKAALRYNAAQEDTVRVAQAVEARNQAKSRWEELEEKCQALPPKEAAEQALAESMALQQSLAAAQARQLPPPPQLPETPVPFQGMSGPDAVAMAQQDRETYGALAHPKWKLTLLPVCLLVLLGLGVFLVRRELWPLALILALSGFLLLGITLFRVDSKKKEARRFTGKYGSEEADRWVEAAREYAKTQREYTAAAEAYRAAREEENRNCAVLRETLSALCGGEDLRRCQERWQEALRTYRARDDAQREYRQCSGHAQALQAMVKPVPPPAHPDNLTHSEAETDRLLAAAFAEQRQLQLKLGQFLGQMEKLGQEEDLRQRLEAVNARIAQLEDTYAALTIAQQTLADATAALQRRFAPRIAQRTQALFAQLTGNRYDRLTLDQDLSLHAGAQGEDTLRSSLWRSDGTVDQLYFALRLAVAGELTPQAPLILDDALVRFDDTRLAEAMEILRREAQSKQVILFTCQSREQ